MGKMTGNGFGKRVPSGARQHATAGPYSPVLEVSGRTIVVTSGQASIDSEGKVIGVTIEEQTEHTIANCRRQLESAGCGLEDVFKVNVYLTNLDRWSDFNKVYERFIPEPRPVRTAVQVGLLPGLLVEIEMWAILR